MNLYSLLAQIPLTLPADSIPAPAQDLKALKSLSFDEPINRMVSGLVEFAIHLAIAILVFYVGKFIIRRLFTITATILHRRNVEQSLTTFVLSLIKILPYLILIITVIGILGINTSSFLAVFASVGVAIGMALSGTLQNFAGGVLILLLKPYKIGDYIEAKASPAPSPRYRYSTPSSAPPTTSRSSSPTEACRPAASTTGRASAIAACSGI